MYDLETMQAMNKAEAERLRRERYCADCNGEAAVKVEDCPKWRSPRDGGAKS